jgi:galactokinase
MQNPEKVKSPLWINYLLGIIRQLHSRKFDLRPFRCVIGGNIPAGAGLSSSAALECGFVYALNEFNRLGLSKSEMITMAQWSEHNYAGVNCGIMDQFASMMGRQGHVFMLDCRSLEYRYFPIVLNGYSIVLINSKVKHSLADSEYNTRRKECEEGVFVLQARFPNIKSLRDVSLDMLQKYRAEFPEVVYNRCYYVVSEIIRVQQATEDLARGDIKAFGSKMLETHEGLSKLYEVSCRELDFLVEHAKNFDGVLGSRMMGGGFGGCTINIVKDDKIESFIRQTSDAYKRAFDIDPSPYVVAVKDGTSVIPSEEFAQHHVEV